MKTIHYIILLLFIFGFKSSLSQISVNKGISSKKSALVLRPNSRDIRASRMDNFSKRIECQYNRRTSVTGLQNAKTLRTLPDKRQRIMPDNGMTHPSLQRNFQRRQPAIQQRKMIRR